MSSRRPRDEFAEFTRQRAAELRGEFRRRFWAPSIQCAKRLLDFVILKLPSSRILFSVGRTLVIFGWVMVLAWPLTELISAWTNGFHLPTTEFPLGDPRDVAVDSQGRFYVVDAYHLRVQRYSPDGEFERGWFVPRKVFAVRITVDDRVIVGAEGGPRTYSSDGEPLEPLPENEVLRQDLVRERQTTGPYAVRHGLIPHIVERETGRTVVDTPWPLRLVASPFPAFLYFVIGVALTAIGELRRSRERVAASRFVSQTT